MAAAKCSDDEFISLFETYGPSKIANLIGTSVTAVYARRNRLEEKLDRQIKCPEGSPNQTRLSGSYPRRHEIKIHDGVVIVGSDAHYWPDIITAAHRGLVHFASEFSKTGELKAVILNGDVNDGAKTGRHARIGWAATPTVQEELQACDERLDEIRSAAKGAELYWTLGNHDQRFETKLSNAAGEYEGTKGVRLSDHFPHWFMCWVIRVNEDVVIKHRYKGGEHATHTNTMRAGRTMVTGHLHSLKVTPYNDYNGTRYGVDTGTLAEPDGEQFDYDEDNPKNHRSGFVVLTFKDGRLLWPEIVAVVDSKHVQFRGKLIKV